MLLHDYDEETFVFWFWGQACALFCREHVSSTVGAFTFILHFTFIYKFLTFLLTSLDFTLSDHDFTKFLEIVAFS